MGFAVAGVIMAVNGFADLDCSERGRCPSAGNQLLDDLVVVAPLKRSLSKVLSSSNAGLRTSSTSRRRAFGGPDGWCGTPADVADGSRLHDCTNRAPSRLRDRLVGVNLPAPARNDLAPIWVVAR